MDTNRLVVDSGPLIVLCDKARWSRTQAWLEAMRLSQVVAVVPPAVITEFLHGTPDWRRAVWWLSHMRSVETTSDICRAAGLLLRLTRDSGVSAVDAHVVQHALNLNANILTSDPRDIQLLLDAAGAKNEVFELPWPS